MHTIYLPNSFTPNNDGRNEVYKPSGMGWDIDTYSMKIYDRWGKHIFASTSVNQGWDGVMPLGTPAAEGVYTVKMFVRALEGKEHYYIQSVTLIR